MNRYARLAAPLALVASLNACASHKITVARPNPTGGEQTASNNSLALGNVQTRTVAECNTNVLDEVTVKRDFGQTLLSILTLGIYQPATVKYRCANIPSEPGTTDE